MTGTVFKIEKGIEMPQGVLKKGPGADKYGFKNMEVGDSFEFPEMKRNNVCSASSNRGKKLGFSFTIRKTSEGVCRIWRTK